jgi:predicted AAA+ superfamily ATPase
MDYAEEIISTGFPGIRFEPQRTRQAHVDAYLANLVQREFAEQGLSVRKPETLRRWLAAYATASSTTTQYSRILDAATPGESDKPARSTTIAYRDVLDGLWILDPVPAWSPVNNEFSRLASTPKHNLADPGLAARLLGATAESLHRGRHDHLLGPLFESLVALCVRVYADAANARVGHFRTRDGDREADLIVEREDGIIIAIEVKLDPTPSDDDTRHLRWLRARLGDDLAAAVVVTAGPAAYTRPDGILVIPLALLGP